MNKHTYLTAGARAESVTVANPAARTATAWSNPSMNRTPMGIESIAGFPMSNTRKKNQSVPLWAWKVVVQFFNGPQVENETYLSKSRIVRRNHVWWEGNKYMKHLRGWSRRKCKVSLIRDSFGNNFEMIHLRDWVNFRDLMMKKKLTSKIVDYHVGWTHVNEA